ncbi:uncharacterized protein LOC124697874 [Lolium rigidum]|uniref:uncharacterized protein LOC124697874 n=1 Tax=Lolium rigidum TaxID=89674 RepID=UPI001F5C6DA7|nr:uncharacterized protein LOC124697874 [Lolium rigidum]
MDAFVLVASEPRTGEGGDHPSSWWLLGTRTLGDRREELAAPPEEEMVVAYRTPPPPLFPLTSTSPPSAPAVLHQNDRRGHGLTKDRGGAPKYQCVAAARSPARACTDLGIRRSLIRDADIRHPQSNRQEEGRGVLALVPLVQQLLPHIPCSYLGALEGQQFPDRKIEWEELCCVLMVGEHVPHVLLLRHFGCLGPRRRPMPDAATCLIKCSFAIVRYDRFYLIF